VSGDNSTRYYDEPTNMKKYLVDLGIPDEHVYIDYAGFDTFDSIYRAEYIF
jgi:SanA protein